MENTGYCPPPRPQMAKRRRKHGCMGELWRVGRVNVKAAFLGDRGDLGWRLAVPLVSMPPCCKKISRFYGAPAR